MYAMVVRTLDGPEALERVELPDPEPGAGEVLVDVHACGCNFGDLLITRGKYQLRPELPFSPGSEVCGVVRRIGAGVAAIAPGERVFAVLPWGGYASAVVVPAPLVVAIPATMTFAQGAAFGVAYQTAHLALVDRARLKPGETLVVHGAAGGVGLAAVEVGAALGARVIATARGADKLELARQHGADLVCDSDDDWPAAVRTATGGAGADVIYDPIGGDTFDRSTRVLAFRGRLLVIGFASGEIPTMQMNRVLLKNIAVLGLNWGAYRDEHPELLASATRELFALYAAGRVRPVVSSSWPLVDAAQALAELAARRTSGKVVLLP